jgi:hypothetical protein
MENVDPSSYTEFPDEEHIVQCSWWWKDRKYEGWFKPEELEQVDEAPETPLTP